MLLCHSSMSGLCLFLSLVSLFSTIALYLFTSVCARVYWDACELKGGSLYVSLSSVEPLPESLPGSRGQLSFISPKVPVWVRDHLGNVGSCIGHAGD